MPKPEIKNVDTAEFNKEYNNILAASQRISESIDALANVEVSDEVREFCLQQGIPIEFVRERLLFKKSVLNKIEKNMFTNPLKDAIPGGPAANTLDITNVKSVKQFERTIEYAPISRYFASDDEESEDSE